MVGNKTNTILVLDEAIHKNSDLIIWDGRVSFTNESDICDELTKAFSIERGDSRRLQDEVPFVNERRV